MKRDRRVLFLVIIVLGSLLVWLLARGFPWRMEHVRIQETLEPSAGAVAPAGEGFLVDREVEGVGTSPMPSPVPIADAEEAARRDAEMYARMTGVDVDTALARLSLQDDIGELNATLTSREGDLFGGLWVQHTPEYVIHIYVTRDEERIYRSYIERTPLEPYVKIERRPATLRDLRASQQAALEIVRNLGVEAMVTLSVQANRVEIRVQDKEAFERLLRERNIALPRFTVVVEGGMVVTREP